MDKKFEDLASKIQENKNLIYDFRNSNSSIKNSWNKNDFLSDTNYNLKNKKF